MPSLTPQYHFSNDLKVLTSFSFSFFSLWKKKQMPKMDGYEATIEIRKSEKAHLVHPIPIVALTAHAMVADEKKCLGVGMNAYLTKPIDYERMVKTIIKLTKKKVAEANNKVVPS